MGWHGMGWDGMGLTVEKKLWAAGVEAESLVRRVPDHLRKGR